MRGFLHAHVGWLFRHGGSSPQRYASDLLRDRDLVTESRQHRAGGAEKAIYHVTEAGRAAFFDALEAHASEQLLAGEMDAYFVIPEHYVLSGQVTLVTRRSVPQALLDAVEGFLRAQIAHSRSGPG